MGLSSRRRPPLKIHCAPARHSLKCTKKDCIVQFHNHSAFVQRGQAAGIWTLAIIAIVEVMTAMVFLVPDVYNQIKEKGRQEGLAKGRAEGRALARAEAREKGRAEGRAAVAAAAREAMRDAGVDDETRRRVEDALARRNRNGN